MLLKFIVLVGLSIYSFKEGEVGLGVGMLMALQPFAGLFLAIFLTVILVMKGWYGTAAILGGLIVFNLVGNGLLFKLSTKPKVDMFGWFKKRAVNKMNALV